ncbi:hypothetical protein FSARC_6517 [Fusarium sarcochroum]|uniref:Uncharacterized protein n=1 Tax=Fusarium sarcochroum TaxID=1208366 RepID=A0A8H4X9A6_9HYPO|nr:hypothetical protein FSARC_6517 [Fusarium sarcochroum]
MHRWALIATFASRALATCYYPDGSNAAKDYKYEPCGNSSTTYSTCCYFGEGDKCLANGLCNQPGKWDYRAACQNKDWSNCPEVCMDSESGTWYPLQKCASNKYCCPPADGSDCCDSGSKVYTLAAPEPSDDSETTTTDVPDATSSGFQSVIRTTIIQSSTATEDPRKNNSVKSSNPVPTIVGGTVGGVSFIGFLFLGVFCVFKRRDKPAKNNTILPTDDTNSSGSNDKDNATVQVVSQTGIAEAEGTEGNRYTESGSDVPGPERQRQEGREQVQRGHSEAEGSAGNIYSEADSRAINVPRSQRRNDNEDRLPQAEREEQEEPRRGRQRYVEVEGSAGNVYPEIDSRAVNAPQRYAEDDGLPEVERQSQEERRRQQRQLAEVEGDAGNVYVEADSRPIGQARIVDIRTSERTSTSLRSLTHELP